MTGTSAGDPVEAEALARSFDKSHDAYDPVLVGSVKTNVGHNEPVSGLAAIIKMTFALKNGLIPPNLKYDTGNLETPLGEWHLRVPITLTPWPKHKLLRASINNFEYGGTNGYVILDPAPIPTISTLPMVLPLSKKPIGPMKPSNSASMLSVLKTLLHVRL